MILQNLIIMVVLQCQPDGSCPYQWYCDSKNQCLHDPVFPATLYPILIYCLFPIASAICNTSGNSFGQFKAILLMDLLDYTQSQATVLTYPLNVGTSLFNYISLIFRRHPLQDTSLVDYNLVIIIIPSVLYGSTIGALVNKYIPPIVADCIIIVMLGAFSVKFFLRFYNFRKQAKLSEQLKQKLIEFGDLSSKNSEINSNIQQLGVQKHQDKTLKQKIVDKQVQKFNQNQNRESSSKQQQQENKQTEKNQYQKQLEQQIKYQSGYHFPDMLLTYVVFGVFQTLSFLSQGKIIPFTQCSIYYKIGVSALTGVFLIMIALIFFYTKRKMLYYKKIKYPYKYECHSYKFFFFVVLASFLGGFNGGAFGLGSSTTMIFTLLFLGIEPIVVSATVAYQIIFSNLASLSEAFIRGDITFQVAGLFIGITFIGGGLLSLISIILIKKMNQNKVNQVLMLIVGCLTGTSVIAVIVNIILSYRNFGPKFMNQSSFQC